MCCNLLVTVSNSNEKVIDKLNSFTSNNNILNIFSPYFISTLISTKRIISTNFHLGINQATFKPSCPYIHNSSFYHTRYLIIYALTFWNHYFVGLRQNNRPLRKRFVTAEDRYKIKRIKKLCMLFAYLMFQPLKNLLEINWHIIAPAERWLMLY